MSAIEQLNTAIDKIGKTFTEFKDANEQKVADLLDRVELMEARRNSPGLGGPSSASREQKVFGDFLRTNNPALLEGKDFSIAGGAASGSGTVPTIIANEIIAKGVDENPIINEVLRTSSDTGDYKRITNRLGATSGWVGETGSRDATSTSTLREISFTGGEVYARPQVTSWIFQDSKFDLGTQVITDAGREFGNRLASAIVLGDGSNKPTGILYSTPTTQTDTGDVRAADVIKYVESSGSPSVLDGDLLITALMDLNSSYRKGAIWLMNSVTLAYCRKLKGSDGHYLWQPSLGAGIDSSDGTLLGKRVVLSELMANVGAGSGAFPILVGDFKRAYELVSVGGMLITRDDNLTSPGYVKWYVRQRYLGRLIDNNALRAIRT